MVRERAYICIDVLANALPDRLQKALWYATIALSLAFLAILAYYGGRFVVMNMRIRSLVIGLNMGIIYSVIPISAVLMAVNLIRGMKEAPEWKL
jgi:TRAP-type C4-dicarboxylate transport system permease small subunit